MENQSNVVIERIKKLMALATHPSTNVNEAAQAAARAQELLFRHKLSMADVEIETGVREGVGILNVDEETELQLKWKMSLMNAVAHGGYCKLVISRPFGDNGKRFARFSIIGKPSDAQTVSYMYSFLLNEINRLCDELAAGKGFAFRNSFRVGATTAIYQRLADQRAAQERPAMNVTETALVIVKRGDAEIATFMAKKYGGKLKDSRGPRSSVASGFEAGRAAGRAMSLGGGKGLGASSKKLTA
jgi:hypothetical protein